MRLLSLAAPVVIAGCSPQPTEVPVEPEPFERTGLTAGDGEALRALDQSYAKA